MNYFFILLFFNFSNSFVINNLYFNKKLMLYDNNNHNNENNPFYRKYPLSKQLYEMQLKRLNSKNITTQLNEINKESLINDEEVEPKNKNKFLKKQ